MSSIKRYQELASKWLDGTITKQEKIEFLQWYNNHQDEEIFIPVSFAKDEEELRERILLKVKEGLPSSVSKNTPHHSSWKTWAIAASVALFLLCGVAYFIYLQQYDHTVQTAGLNDIQPGGNKAVLTLPNGKTINLSEQKNGLTIGDDIQYMDGSSVAEMDEIKEEREKIAFVTLSTPKGGQYQINLSDGTQIWLNSSSSIRVPKRFKEEYREVELVSGEAYFKVNPHKDKGTKIPFYVKNEFQLVKVLGTEFNINTYEADNTGIVTTVAEGTVTVQRLGLDHTHPSSDNVKLTIGKQSVLRNDGIKVNEVDPEMFVAWKDGYFYFNDADIYTVMKEFTRWYDIDVKYELSHPDQLFVGKIPKNVPLGIALNVLKRAGVKFEMNGSQSLIIKDK